MKDSPLPPGTLAAEFLGVLLAYPAEYFAPGELASALRACPTWQKYLADFETDRGQPAVIGRYLNDLGLSKTGHHRTRGSLYSSQTTLNVLQERLDEVRRVRSEELADAEAPEWDLDSPQVETALAKTLMRPAAVMLETMEGGVRTDEEADEGVPERRDPTVLMMDSGRTVHAVAPSNPAPELVNPPPKRRSGELPAELGANSEGRNAGGEERTENRVGVNGDGTATAPARSGPMMGWRRRSTDLARSPRPQAATAHAEAATASLPSYATAAIPVAGYAGGPYPMGGGGLPPQVWSGGGATGFAGTGMSAYTGGLEFSQPGAGVEDAGLPLSFYWTQIRRHLYKIILAAVLVTTLAGLYTLKIPKLYESVVTLRMDFKEPAFSPDNSNSSAESDAFDPSTLIQTEVTDVTQRGVILDAITNGHLDQDVNLQKQAHPRGGGAPTTANPDALNDALVGLIQSETAAISPDNTHNIDIHFKSLDPGTSAAVANALASALIFHEFQTRQQEQDDSLKFMTQQFNDIKARMETEQTALTDYQHQNNILNPDGQSNLQNATLTTLNQSFLASQDALTKYESEENILKTGQITDALLASDDGAVLRPTYDAWRAAQLQFDQIKATRGSANPEYRTASNQLGATRLQLDTAIESVKNQIDSQYQRAQDQEKLVAKQLEAARAAAQSFNDKAIDYDAKRRDLDADQKLYDALQAQIKEQQLTTSLSSSNLRVTNQATPNPAPVYPNVRQNVMLAALFSLFFGCALAVLAGYMDRSFTSPDGVEQYLRIPLLGALPVIANKANLIELADQPPEMNAIPKGKTTPRSPFAESILMLRTAVLYAAPHGFRTLSITSAQPQEGKSVILANLAIALALHGSKVLLVDGDIRRPTQHRIFEVPNQVGLSSLLRQSAALETCFRATMVEKLYLMPAGPAVPNPSELVATMLAQVLAPLTAEFDYVLVDSPPVLGFADAVSISTVVEGTLLVARAGKTQRELVQAALQPLKRVRARVLGLVLNQVSSSLSPYYSYYRNHYARYYGGREDDNEPEAKA